MTKKHRDIYSDTIADVGLPAGYFERTSRPVYALIYLLPLIMIYEVLVLAINPQLLISTDSTLRGGVVSFVWIQNFLQHIGMDTRSSWLAAPMVVVVILTGLQFTSGKSWKLNWTDFGPMVAESILLALPLIVLALVLNRPAVGQPRQSDALQGRIIYCQNADVNSGQYSAGESNRGSSVLTKPVVMELITGIGAGIYEELIFRLILISGFMLFFENLIGLSRTKSVIISILLSALLFSVHHHIVFMNGEFVQKEIFTLPRFVFRALAGIYFAAVFAVRGFGVAAGAHVFYDVIAVLLNTIFFE